MNKEELVQIIINDFADAKGNIDLEGLDFKGHKGKLNINGVKNLKGTIYQGEHTNDGDIEQNKHKNEGHIIQWGHESDGNIYQFGHLNIGKIYQSKHEWWRCKETYIKQKKERIWIKKN